MPLQKSTLQEHLERQLGAKPASLSQAASDWASAYVSYASAALSAGGSLPVTALANQALLVSAFTAALQSQSSSGAAAAMAQGVTAFWSALVWVGPGMAGTTLFPGNPALLAELSAIFADTSDKTDADKARALADAFDAGAKLVLVNDVQLSTGVPIVGPVS